MSNPRLSLQQKNTTNKNTTTNKNAKTNMNINTNIKIEQPAQPAIDWESEQQLVTSLAKLQELESKIHTLRTLLPNRLLAPLNPIVNEHQQRFAASNNPLPQNPQDLNARLKKAAVRGVAEVAEFRALWQSPEMHAIWVRLTQKMIEGKGAFPQPSGMWERDYAELLRDLEKDEKKLGKDGDDDTMKNEDSEAAQQVDAAGWKAIVDSFQQRQIPHFRITTSKTSSSMLLVHLGLAGVTLELEQATSSSSSSPASTQSLLPDWRVSTHSSSSRPVSRLETAIVQQLNARRRKWDLRYLLEMILAYADIRRSPCKKCNMMTDSQAQLPVVRRAVQSDIDDKIGTTEGKTAAWEAFHTNCAPA